jgi:hypothetical protein
MRPTTSLIQGFTALAVLACSAITTSAHAYYSTLDTADSLGSTEYRMALEPNFILNRDSGANMLARFDTGTSEHGDVRLLAGGGVSGFIAGALYKLIPFPDYENQPGIGAEGGLLFTNNNGNAAVHLRIHPLVSKRFATDGAGEFTPYASVPFGITFGQKSTTYPAQLAGGTKWVPEGFKHLALWGELGLELNAAFSYVSIGVSTSFDSFEHIRFD